MIARAPSAVLRRVAAALMAAAIATAAMADDLPVTRVDEGPLLARRGDVFLAGQPRLADFDAWAARGVTTVINMRSRAEIAALPYDSAAEAAARGLRYWEIPMGRADGYDPAQRAQLTALLNARDGPVVLYCRTGRRVSWAYAAHLIADGAAPRDTIEALDWPRPLSHARITHLLDADAP